MPNSSRAVVDESPGFARSLLALPDQLPRIDLREVWWRVFEFRTFKIAHGNVPFRRYGEDKPSWHNAEGRLISAYHDDGFHHCHLGVVAADPILAYAGIAPGHLVMVCVTTHQAMFKGDRRAFVREHAAHFPNTLRRRPALRARPPAHDTETE
ncbi:MAG TPA: hypothetical protein VMU81_21945 [Acetobacteraceae bacterium]|nr:hypothetical protein [Acetobacteraceae bacterium]